MQRSGSGIPDSKQVLRIRNQLLFSMRIRVQLHFYCGFGSSLKKCVPVNKLPYEEFCLFVCLIVLFKILIYFSIKV